MLFGAHVTGIPGSSARTLLVWRVAIDKSVRPRILAYKADAVLIGDDNPLQSSVHFRQAVDTA